MGPLTPCRSINLDVVIPRIGEAVSLTLRVVAPVVAEVNGELQRSRLARVTVEFAGGKGGF